MFSGTLSEYENKYNIQLNIIENCFKKHDIKTKNSSFKYNTVYYIYNNYSHLYKSLRTPERCVFIKKKADEWVQFQKIGKSGNRTGFIHINTIVDDDGYVYGISEQENINVLQEAKEQYYYHINNLYYLCDDY